MKKMIKLLTILTLMITCANGVCTHVHDEQCGYDPETQTGCTHECEYTILPKGKLDPED